MVSTPHSYGAFLTRSGLRGTTSDETTIGRRPKSVATTAAMAIGPKDVTIARCSPVLRASSVYPAPESAGKTRSPLQYPTLRNYGQVATRRRANCTVLNTGAIPLTRRELG